MKLINQLLLLFLIISSNFLIISGCSSNGPYRLADYSIEEKGTSVVVDSSGNVYITGLFCGSTDFDPGADTEVQIANDLNDTFISKFESSGEFSWVETWGGTLSPNSEHRLVAVNDNFVFVTGTFQGTLDLNPGPQIDEHTGRGVYLIKFTSNGEFLWARAWNVYEINNIAIDINSDIFVTGSLHDNVLGFNHHLVDLDPGPEVDEYPNSGNFLTKFNSEGTYQWSKTWNTSSSAVAVDVNNGIYLSGVFTGQVDFDPGDGEEIHSGSDSFFVSKLDTDGNFNWARTMIDAIYNSLTFVAVDTNSDVIVGGSFSNTPSLNPDRTTDSKLSNGGEDIILLKFTSGGDLIWETALGGSEIDRLHGIAVNNNNDIFATGYFTGRVDFNPGNGTDEHRSRGPGAFLMNFDPSGNFGWARTWDGSGWDKANGIAVDYEGVYVTGEFCNRVNFDPGSGTDLHTSTGYNDIFLSRFDHDGNFIWAKTWGGENPISGT
jgi:hypothetical protein